MLLWVLIVLLSYFGSGVIVMMILRHLNDSERSHKYDKDAYPLLTLVWPLTLVMAIYFKIAETWTFPSVDVENFVERITRPPTRTYKD